MKRATMLIGASLILTVATCMAQTGSLSEEGGDQGASGDVRVRVQNIDPFTHRAYILPGSDLKSIKFDGAKIVKVATQVKETFNPGYCEEMSHSDPGGSMYCPVVEHGAYESAYSVKYSYIGPPLASDEYNQKWFTLTVFFRPEELDGAEPGSFLRAKAAEAESLEVATSRDPIKALFVNEDASEFCPGNYVDGNWVPDQVTCEEKVAFRVVTVPSDYITVLVEPARGRMSGDQTQ